MKKTSLMQSLQTRFSPKTLRNGLLLLLLVCVMGVSETRAQSTEVGEYVSVEQGVYFLQKLSLEANDTFKENDATIRIGFYGTLSQKLEEGLSYETALDYAQDLVLSKVLSRNWATPADIQQIRDEVDTLLRQ